MCSQNKGQTPVNIGDNEGLGCFGWHILALRLQPRWGCLCLWPLPGVAPRRRNPGLYGRIPSGFPEGDRATRDSSVSHWNYEVTRVGIPGGGWGNARPSDSRTENGDRPTLGVSGWGNWSAPIPTVMIPLGFPEGDGARHDLGDSQRGNGDRPPPAAFPCT